MIKQKVVAFIEVLFLANLFIVSSTWHIIFNNKRCDYAIVLKNLKKPKKKINKQKFADMMKRLT